MGIGGGASDFLRIGSSNVSNDSRALVVIFGNESQTLAFGGRNRLFEDTSGSALVEGDAPAVGMGADLAASWFEQGQRMVHIGDMAGAHTKQFTHNTTPLKRWLHDYR